MTEKVDNGNEYQHGDIRIEHASGENVKDVGIIVKH